MTKKCVDLVHDKYKDRAEQFSNLLDQCTNETLKHENYGKWSEKFNESILAFDFVKGNTFKNQPDGYWRLQLSWGGPSDEIRYYKGDHTPAPKYDQITYCYMDWFDGAEIQVHADIWHDIFNDFVIGFEELKEIKAS